MPKENDMLGTNITVPKNTERWLFIDTTPDQETAKYARLGKGVTAATPSNSPTVQSQHYIDASAPTHSITGLEKTFALTMERYVGDGANDYLSSLDDKTGDDVKTTLVIVDLTTEASTAVATAYHAKKYEVVVGLDQPYSVEGGASQAMSCTIYTNGDPVEGWFDTSDSSWSDTEPVAG